MKAPSTAKPEQSRHHGSSDRSGHGQGQQAMAVLDNRPEMEQQQSLLSLLGRKPNDRRLTMSSTIRTQALQRLLEDNAGDARENSTATEIARFGHDFSRIPVNAKGNADSQPVLAIGTPGNIHEREADRAAEQLVQRKPAVGGIVSFSQESDPQTQSDRSGQNLSAQDRYFFEPHFGQVRIHSDARSAEMADALNAEAFTVGRDIYFGAGKLQPRTKESDQLLAHKLAHVVQQSRTAPVLQPKLKITGKAGDLSRAMTLLNSGLLFYTVSLDKSGNLSISANKTMGPPSGQQQALASRLTTIINDPKDVIMTVSAGSKTLVGSYATGDFDIADIEAIGVSALIHEIEEQYQKQVKSVAFGSETTGAHGEGIKAESEVKGAKRGAQNVISSSNNADGTLDAVVEIPYTYPDGKVKTMVMTIVKNNVTSVTWK